MSLVERKIEELIDHHWATVAHLRTLYEAERCVSAGTARYGGKVSVFRAFHDGLNVQFRVVWEVTLESFRDALPLLEFVEDWRPPMFQFAITRDYPTLGQREFKSRNLEIWCTLRDASEGACRAVVVGFREPEPIMEFVCE